MLGETTTSSSRNHYSVMGFTYNDRMRPMSVVVGVFLFVAIASCCMWDRDTLLHDYKRFPTTIEAIVGRIDREPPLYYQMRKDRVRRQLQENPFQPDLYDDIAVAESRLGNYSQGIRWMDRKAKLSLTVDQRYRLLSNRGTFRFLAWVTGGRTSMRLLDAAVRDIEKALIVNPGAHFGRERVQLALMEWARDVNAPGQTFRPSLGVFLLHRFPGRSEEDKIIVGLTGLIVLGEVWESPDVMASFADPGMFRGTLAYFGRLRATELYQIGKRSLGPLRNTPDNWDVGSSLMMGGYDVPVRKEFRRLRDAADLYRAKREEFMMARLRAGRHPDTDPDFWIGWTAPSFTPRDPVSPIYRHFIDNQYTYVVLGTPVAIVLLTFAVVKFARKRFRVWKAVRR